MASIAADGPRSSTLCLLLERAPRVTIYPAFYPSLYAGCGEKVVHVARCVGGGADVLRIGLDKPAVPAGGHELVAGTMSFLMTLGWRDIGSNVGWG